MNQEKREIKKITFLDQSDFSFVLTNTVRTFYNFSGKLSRVFDKISKIF